MNTNTDALRERFAEALHYGLGYDDWGAANEDERGVALELADEVLPIVAEAQAEAWDEGHSWGWSDAQEAHDVRQAMDRADWTPRTPNPYKETDR